MLDDPQAPPLRGSAEVFATARRSARRAAGRRAAAATLALAAVAGSWALLRNDSAPRPRVEVAPSVVTSTTPMQLTAADVAQKLEPPSTPPMPPTRVLWILEGKSSTGRFYWYIDVLEPVSDPCGLPFDVPHHPAETCLPLRTESGQVWVRRLPSVPGVSDGIVVSIYVPAGRGRALLYTASSVELPGVAGTWGTPGYGSPFEIADSEIAEIAKMAQEFGQG